MALLQYTNHDKGLSFTTSVLNATNIKIDGEEYIKLDVKQLITRYENAKAESKRLQRQSNPECRFEAGKAYALESVLRDLGLDYTDVASGRFYEEK